MAVTLARLQTIVKGMVKNASAYYTDDELDTCLEGACATYSRYRSLTFVKQYTATGGRVYSLPDEWDYGFSEDHYQVEYPVNDDASVPSVLLASMTGFYDTPDGKKLRFTATDATNALPPQGAVFRLHVPIRYSATELLTNIPTSDVHPFCALAASYLCLTCASAGAQLEDGVIEGGTVDYKNRDDKFVKLAREYFKIFKDAIVPDATEVEAAAAFGVFTTDDYHRDAFPAFPRDESGRTNADI